MEDMSSLPSDLNGPGRQWERNRDVMAKQIMAIAKILPVCSSCNRGAMWRYCWLRCRPQHQNTITPHRPTAGCDEGAPNTASLMVPEPAVDQHRQDAKEQAAN